MEVEKFKMCRVSWQAEEPGELMLQFKSKGNYYITGRIYVADEVQRQPARESQSFCFIQTFHQLYDVHPQEEGQLALLKSHWFKC